MRGRKLTLDEKLRIIKEVEKGRSKTKVGREFNLKYQAVHKIWQKREQIAKKLDKEFSKPVEAAVDEELIAWYREENTDDVSDKVLFNKAEELIDLFGSQFDDATEWVEEFKLRHGIFFEASEGESDCESDSEKNPDNEATCEDLDYSSDEAESLVCLECDVGFTSKYYLYNHLLHHVKQPAVTLKRIDVPQQPTLNPIRIVFKCRENNFEIISSPQASPKIADLKETADRADITGSLEDDPLATGEMATIEEIENETELDTNVTFSPNYISTDNLEPEKEDTEMETPDEKPEYNNIPGAEPTPPPEPSPEYPKIRIKSGLLKEPLTITEITDDNPNGEYTNQSTEYQNLDNYGSWATPSLEDPLRLPDAGENDSSLLSNLFTNNNDRAKDLGFTTSDTEFISLDSNRSSSASTALQVYNSSANSMISSNPLDTLTNLPMQQLAQQVSRLQPNGSNGMHQQNVLINIQQFPQAPPPQQHSYQPHMYPPHPPQPMYHQPYQPYQPPNMYYPQAPGYPPHMPPPPRPQMPPQMPPPQQQMQQQQQQQHQQQHQQQMQNSQQPPPYRQQAPRQQQPMAAPRQPMQQGPRAVQGGPRGPQMGNRFPSGPRQPGMVPRQRAPMIRGRGGGPMMGARGPRPRMPMQNGGQMQGMQQQNGPRMIKRSPEQMQALQAKRKKMDVLVPDKHDDADCQVIAVTPKNTGLPQIQSIQGAATDAGDNSVMHLSDSITLSVRNPPPKPASPKKSDAKDVANILATRGITVTATAKSKEAAKATSKSPEPAVPVAINLNSSVCIIPTKNQGVNAPSGANNKDNKLATVDLTDDTVEPQPPQQQKQMPGKQQQTNKVLPFQCDLCPAKYTNSLNLSKHRQSFHKTGSNVDYGVPLIDLKSPGVVQRLASLGIHNYIPLPGANSETTFALPIINANTYKNGNLNNIGATQVLTLGPVRMLPKPVQNHK